MTFADIQAIFFLFVALYCFVTLLIATWKDEWAKATYHLVLLIWILQIKK